MHHALVMKVIKVKVIKVIKDSGGEEKCVYSIILKLF